MIRFAADTDDLNLLSDHFELQFTYSDLVTDLTALRRKYPNSEIGLIDRGLGDPTGEATIFDIETGALTLSEAVLHYDDARARGLSYLTIYHDRARASEVNAAFGARKPYQWWATLDGTAHIAGYDPLFGPAIIQCLNATALGARIDGSLVYEDSWHPSRGTTNRIQLSRLVAQCQARDTDLASDLHALAVAIGG